MDYRASRRNPVQPSRSPSPGKAAAGPSGGALAGVAAGLDASPRVARLKALAGVVQRVVATDDLEATKTRLGLQGVPAEVVDHYQALPNTYTEEEILLAHKGPNAKKPMQSSFPKVVRTGGENPISETSLIYRGMSVNNVRNLQQSALTQDQTEVIFNAQNPEGQATEVQHIVDDHPDSPFLSFEARGYDISAGKYAPKPIGPNGRKPRGVRRKKGAFLKQVPSYTGETRNKYDQSSYVGYVGGLSPQDLETLDVSTPDLATQNLTDVDADREANARRIAVNDREVLLKPGEGGVPRSKVPFVAKVKEVTRDYYEKKLNRQTSTKALGFFKPANSVTAKTRYLKTQIPEKYTQGYGFDVPEHLRKQNDDDESDISDVESIDLDMEGSDFSGGESDQDEEEEQQEALVNPVLEQQPVIALDQQPVALNEDKS